MKKLFVVIVLINVIFSEEIISQVERENSNYGEKIVAEVGNIRITADEFISGYEFGPAFYKREKNSKKIYLDNLIREKLLALDGYARFLDTTQNVKEYYQAILDDIATEELFKDSIQSKITFTHAEIDTVAKQKLIEVEVLWLYSPTEKGIVDLLDSLKHGTDFQTLFNRQLNDSVTIDDRSMKTTRYQVELKNPQLGKIVDKLEHGKYSLPVKTNDGWYIVMLKNFSYNLITSETEQNKILEEARRAVIKMKMDHLSNEYVNKLMLAHNPIIKRKAFQILRSYLANFELPKKKYFEWKMDKILSDALKAYNIDSVHNYASITLVELNDSKITIADFLKWYRTRDEYIKYDKRSFANFSRSLEQIIWRMVRDKLLTAVAKNNGYYNSKDIMKQSKWWLDKILYSTVKNELTNSIILEHNEMDSNKVKFESQSELIENELTKKIFHKLNELKKKYSVVIHNEVLDKIKVGDENDPKAVDFYFIKRDGLIPRTPYPTIDVYWANWQ
ncbi:hypothetical protein ABRY23_13605 [Melioribacteraceae bacterium 4301-Me]|uniref:hypothetical protein n=1 Tax=Pyranulibacter aquaticus TaxID=3163344 RepID=UPI00359B2511